MSTLAPSAGTISGRRTDEAMKRSSSPDARCCSAAAAPGDDAASATAAPSLGKNASTEPAPPTKSSASAMANGFDASTVKSAAARRGRLSIGMEVAAPETMNRPITAAYVIRHSTHTSFNTTNDAYPRYRITASPSVDPAKRYAGTLSRMAGRAVSPATDSSVASVNQMVPKTATEMPCQLPKRLLYTCVQLKVALTSQKLRYVGSASTR